MGKPKKRLLSSAPRRDHDYIQVVIFNSILNLELCTGDNRYLQTDALARYGCVKFEIG